METNTTSRAVNLADAAGAMGGVVLEAQEVERQLR